jgi:hypothetical protein
MGNEIQLHNQRPAAVWEVQAAALTTGSAEVLPTRSSIAYCGLTRSRATPSGL